MQCSITFQSVMGAIVGDTRDRDRVLLSIVVGTFNLFDRTRSELSCSIAYSLLPRGLLGMFSGSHS